MQAELQHHSNSRAPQGFLLGQLQDDGSIGIFADPQGTDPCLQAPPGVSEFFIIASTAGATAGGIAGADFRIEVSDPDGYLFNYIPPEGVGVQLGTPFDLEPENPFNLSGLSVFFQDCQLGEKISLGRVRVINFAAGGTAELLIKRVSSLRIPSFSCPSLSVCEAREFLPVCTRPCAIDDTGESIVFKTTLNDPNCPGEFTCPEDCAEKPCVDVEVPEITFVCEGKPIEVEAIVTNCSAEPQDLDVLINTELVQTFENVPAGQSFPVSGVVPYECGSQFNRFPVAVLARNIACPEVVGREVTTAVICRGICPPDLPPDCATAQASVSELWPPNHRLVEVGIVGVTDPEGEAVRIQITSVSQDEPTNARGDGNTCPDAIVSTDQTTARLRAERQGPGNGRVYTVSFVASDPGGQSCTGSVQVCAHDPGANRECVEDDRSVNSTECDLQDSKEQLRVTPETSGTTIQFSQESSSRIEIGVYDLRGRLVRQLWSGNARAREHEWRWDGRNDAGRQVARGLYLVRVQTAHTVHTTKALMLR